MVAYHQNVVNSKLENSTKKSYHILSPQMPSGWDLISTLKKSFLLESKEKTLVDKKYNDSNIKFNKLQGEQEGD